MIDSKSTPQENNNPELSDSSGQVWPADLAVKQFSKEHSAVDRDLLAGEINLARQKRFKEKRENKRETERILSLAETKEQNSEEIIQQIYLLEESLKKTSATKISKILHILDIYRLKKELGVKNQNAKTVLSDYESLKDSFNQLDKQRAELEDVSSLKGKITEFYHGQEKKWLEYQDDEKSRDVNNIINDNNVLLVHGFQSFIPGNNSMLQRNVSQETRLGILLGLEPTISASTIKPGDKPENMWSRSGVILGGGRIGEAHPFDNATVASGVTKRKSKQEIGVNIKEQIREAMDLRPESDFNELVVENPNVVGYYVCLDPYQGSNYRPDDLPPAMDITFKYVTEELGLPFFIIEHGVAREATSYDRRNRVFTEKEPLEAKEVIKVGKPISEAKKLELRDQVLENSPFKILSPEIKNVYSLDDGRQIYLELSLADKKFDQMDIEEVPYSPKRGGEHSPIKIGEKVKLITSSSVKGVQYFLTENGLIKKENRNGEVNFSQVGQPRLIGIETVGIVRANTHEEFTTITEYLAGIGRLIDKQSKEPLSREMSEKLAFHLYGIGEEAAHHGDAETEKKALELADSLTPISKIQEVVSRRIGVEGKLVVTKEDLE